MSFILGYNPVGGTIARLPPCAAVAVILLKTRFLDRVKFNSTSQLISGIF